MWVYIALILITLKFSLSCPCCEKKESLTTTLDAAVDLLTKAKSFIPFCPQEAEFYGVRVIDCADLYKRGYNKSGVYSIWPIHRLTMNKRLDVYCDMTTNGGGWTVLQRRGKFERANDYFDKEMTAYKQGFGDLTKDFWLGTENIFILTNQKENSVRFDLEDKKGSVAYAHYDNFWIDDAASEYMLHISDYSGNAGDGMKKHNGKTFVRSSSVEGEHCVRRSQSGWWSNICYFGKCKTSVTCNTVNLNGMYNDLQEGIIWNTWKNEYLSRTEIKIRPSIF